MCTNKIDSKGQIIKADKIDEDHLCCICFGNEKNNWLKCNGCTCTNSPGHLDCLVDWYHFTTNFQSLSIVEFNNMLIQFQTQIKFTVPKFSNVSILEMLDNTDNDIIYTSYICQKIRASRKFLEVKNSLSTSSEKCLICQDDAKIEVLFKSYIYKDFYVKAVKGHLCNKFNCRWAYIHMFPKFEDLKARYLHIFTCIFDPCERYIYETIQINKYYKELNQLRITKKYINYKQVEEIFTKIKEIDDDRIWNFKEDLEIYKNEFYEREHFF
jgi:hypothetical protein